MSPETDERIADQRRERAYRQKRKLLARMELQAQTAGTFSDEMVDRWHDECDRLDTYYIDGRR